MQDNVNIDIDAELFPLQAATAAELPQQPFVPPTGSTFVSTISGQSGNVVLSGGNTGFTYSAGGGIITLTSPLTTKGDLYAFSTTGVRLGVGSDGQVLSADSTQVTGLKWIAPSAGTGTVTTVSVVTANGVSGSVANPTDTPAITLTLGAITPTSVAASGTVAGSNLSGTNTGDQTSVSGNAGTATALQTARNIDGQSFNGSADITVIAPGTHAATSKATPVDADELPLVDSAASNVLKKLTWANVKATLKTYFDTLYGALGNMPAFARVTGSNATTTNTTATDITGLSVALLASSVYKFTANLTGNGADANGMKFGVNFSAAGAAVEAGIIADTAGTGTRTRRINALNTLTAQAFFTSATDVAALITGVMRTGANAGNLTIQYGKVVSGTATIYIDSCLTVTKIS